MMRLRKNVLTRPQCWVKKYSFIEEPFAGVAQPVEQLICNQQVAGSSPIASSRMEGFPSGQRGQTVNLLAQPSEVQILPPPPQHKASRVVGVSERGGNSSVGRASAFQAERRGFESRFPLQILYTAVTGPWTACRSSDIKVASLKESRFVSEPT